MAGGDSAESMRGWKRLERDDTPLVRACHDQWGSARFLLRTESTDFNDFASHQAADKQVFVNTPR